MPKIADADEINEACALIRQWHSEGKNLPGYIPNHGKPFMTSLLDLDMMLPTDTYTENFIIAYKKGNHTLVEKLLGPHGWAVMQAAIIKMQERNQKCLTE